MQMHTRLVAPADKKLFHAHFVGDLLERLLRIADRKRHQNGARPRRNFVNIEPEPVRKQHDLRRNRRNRVVVVLPKETQIDLGKCIHFGHAAHGKNLLAGAAQRWMLRRESSQLQSEIGFYRSANIRRTTRVDTPSAIFVLMIQDIARSLVKTFLVARTKQRVQQNVIGFKSGVSFKLTAPITLFVLLRKKVVACRVYAYCDPAPQVINFSKSHLWNRGRILCRITDRTRGGGFFHYVSTATAAGAAAIVATISGGSPNRTFSGIISSSCRSPKPFPARYSTTSCTKCSGADAPAVKATVFTSFNHCG